MEMYQSEGGTAFTYGPYTEMSARLDLNNAAQVQKKLMDAATSTPNLDTVTSSTEDQWMLESCLVSEVESAWATVSSCLPIKLSSFHCLSQSSSPDLHHAGSEDRFQRMDMGHVSEHRYNEECERRRVRRERNRIAAARCRDRRRMLMDALQNETEHLELVKTQLEDEIAGLERERERLELVLEAHRPICKMDGINPE